MANARWIPVSERLPEIADADTEESAEVWVFQKPYLSVPWSQFNSRYSHRFGAWCKGIDWLVTHWQPLPEPPEDA